MRTVLNEKQLFTLRTCYGANPRPDALMKEQLVEMTSLSPRVIRVWFQNKRKRAIACALLAHTIIASLRRMQRQEENHPSQTDAGATESVDESQSRYSTGRFIARAQRYESRSATAVPRSSAVPFRGSVEVIQCLFQRAFVADSTAELSRSDGLRIRRR